MQKTPSDLARGERGEPRVDGVIAGWVAYGSCTYINIVFVFVLVFCTYQLVPQPSTNCLLTRSCLTTLVST